MGGFKSGSSGVGKRRAKQRMRWRAAAREAQETGEIGGRLAEQLIRFRSHRAPTPSTRQDHGCTGDDADIGLPL